MKKSKSVKANKAKSLIHDSFPDQGPIQAAYQGSQSVAPPTSPDMMAPQMPSYDNSQMSPSGEY